MIPTRFFHFYHFAFAIGTFVAGLIFLAFSIYSMVDSHASHLSLILFFFSIWYLFTGLLLGGSVNFRGQVRRTTKLLIPMALMVFCLFIVQLVFWILFMIDWPQWLHQLMLLEYPRSGITRWVDTNDIVVKVIVFLYVPFSVFWMTVVLYVLKVGHL